jgi:hypothetical protein
VSSLLRLWGRATGKNPSAIGSASSRCRGFTLNRTCLRPRQALAQARRTLYRLSHSVRIPLQPVASDSAPLSKSQQTSSKRIATSCKGSGDLFEEDRDLLQEESGPLQRGPPPLARGVRISSKRTADLLQEEWGPLRSRSRPLARGVRTSSKRTAISCKRLCRRKPALWW